MAFWTRSFLSRGIVFFHLFDWGLLYIILDALLGDEKVVAARTEPRYLAYIMLIEYVCSMPSVILT